MSGDRSHPSIERFFELNRRLRLAFLAGAEERSRSGQGRGLTDDQLGRVLAKYPGDLPSASAGEDATSLN